MCLRFLKSAASHVFVRVDPICFMYLMKKDLIQLMGDLDKPLSCDLTVWYDTV